MEGLKHFLSGIAIGVKFRNNYSIEDHLGSILDELLYKKNSLFNYVIFPRASSDILASQKRLHNPDTDDMIIINKNCIILDINFSEKIPKEKSDVLIEEFFLTITDHIYKIVNIRDIYLIGIVHKYTINDGNTNAVFHKKFKEITVDDATSITLEFTKKNMTPESKLRKGNNSYENVITTISMTHDKDNEYLLQVDYQHIFDPRLDSIVDIKYKDFVDKVNYYNTNTISKWVKSNE